MSKKIELCFGEEGPDVLPLELWAIAELLAERRGEQPEDTLAAMVEELILKTDPDEFGKSLAAEDDADRRYCQAEGLANVRDYSAGKERLQLKAGLAELLAELRAEPWRKDWPGLDM